MTNHLKKHLQDMWCPFPGFRGKKKVEDTLYTDATGKPGLVTACVGEGDVVNSYE